MKPLHLILALLFALAIPSRAIRPDPIVGTWILSNTIVTGCKDSKMNSVSPCPTQTTGKCWTMLFNSDGSYSFTNSDADQRGSYSVNSNTLTTRMSDGGIGTWNFTMAGKTFTFIFFDAGSGCQASYVFSKSASGQ
jgi:hypothetical protein